MLFANLSARLSDNIGIKESILSLVIISPAVLSLKSFLVSSVKADLKPLIPPPALSNAAFKSETFLPKNSNALPDLFISLGIV